MNVDPQTGFYVTLGLIALVGLGVLVYAKMFLLDSPQRKDKRKRH